MAGQGSSVPQQDGLERYLDYFDIMLLGKTGAGKTTTADKILAANPSNIDYSEIPEQESVVITMEDPDNEHLPPQVPEGVKTSEGAAATGSNEGRTRTIRSTGSKCHDLTMWHLSEGQKEVQNMTQRLKRLTLARVIAKPHEEILNIRKDSNSTSKCELLSNDTSRVRVLDVPGFYGPDACLSSLPRRLPSRSDSESSSVDPNSSVGSSVRERVREATETDLSLMRKVLHIKMAMKFKFNRIVYFLPETGVLNRTSQVLQTELGIMENYFGTSIFECMTVAATYDRSAYEKFAPGANLYTSSDFERTRFHFQEALRMVLKKDDVPEPPIIFMSLWDSCEDVLEKIKTSKVAREGVNLSFNPSTCARCGIKIGRLKEEKHKREGKGEGGADVVAVAAHTSFSAAVPYEESTCHPMLIPKYTAIQKIVGGIVHLVTFKAFLGKWPDFGSMDEQCICCKQPPKAGGCTKVHTMYVDSKHKDGIYVDHNSMVNESFVIELDPDDEVGETEPEATIVLSGTGKYFMAKNEAFMSKDVEKQHHEGNEREE